jgi:hypothetical protein
MMKKLRPLLLPSLIIVITVFFSQPVIAYQIWRDLLSENPSGNTVAVSTPDATNDGLYKNHGSLLIYVNGVLTNSAPITGALTNESDGSINIYEPGTLKNNHDAGLDNYGSLNNFGGTIDNSGALNNKTGGTLNNFSGGLLSVNGSGWLNNNGSLTNWGRLQFASSTSLNNISTGTIINFGFLGCSGHLNNYGTLSNFGQLSSTSGTLYNSGTLNNNSGGTLTVGPLYNQSGGTIRNDGELVNDGTLTNYSGGILDNYGTLKNNTGTINNFGTLTNYSGGTLENNGTLTNNGTLNNSGDLFNVFFFSTLTNNGTLTNSGRIVNGNMFVNGGSLANSGTINIWSSGTLTNNSGGTLTNYSGGILDNYGRLNNTGTINNFGTLTNYSDYGGGILENNGTLTNNGGGTLNNNTGSALINNAGLYNRGTLLNNGTISGTGNYYQYAGQTINNGSMTQSSIQINGGTLLNNGTISGTGNYYQYAGQTINNGSMTQASIQINGGSLSGTGTIYSNVTIASGASVNPGNSPGTLTINGTFSSSGELVFEIGGLLTGQYDVLDINGNAIFTGGNIKFDFIKGFNASAGDHWDFLFANSITGWDNLTFDFNGLGSGLGWKFENFISGERLVITQNGGGTSVPEPATMLLLITGLAGLVAFRKKFIQ